MRNTFLTGLLLVVAMPYALPQQAVKVKEGIQLKIEAEIAPQMQEVIRTQQANAISGQLQTGIQRFDALNKRFGATSLRRIFPDAGEYEELHRKAGLHLWYELSFDDTTKIDEAVAAYSSTNGVEHAWRKYPIKRISHVVSGNMPAPALPVRAATSDDPYFTEQWYLHNTGQYDFISQDMDINLPEAWDYSRGNTDVIVAIVDGGIDVDHPDLKNAIWSGIGKNFVSQDKQVSADDHGTHVAGIIGAITNNNIGISGIAGGSGNNNGVKLMSCQIFEGDNGVEAAEAIIYAADKGAIICQNSWGYEEEGVYNKADSVAIRYFINHAGKKPDGSPRPEARMKGGIVIFAAGNDDTNKRIYPAYFDFVTSVAAVGPSGRKASYSNYGTWIDITAVGGDVYRNVQEAVLSTVSQSSTYEHKHSSGEDYGWMQGTSMACPQVSGVAALILSKYGHKNYIPDSLRIRLIHSARSLASTDPTYSAYMGKGFLDAGAALSGTMAQRISIKDFPTEMAVGDTYTLSVSVEPENALNREVKFISGNPSIITLSEKDGETIAVAKSTGTVTITAKTIDDSLEDACSVEIFIPVSGVSVTPRIVKLKKGNTVQLEAQVEPAQAKYKEVTWQSNNTPVASVSHSGLVTGIDGGAVNNPKIANITLHTSNPAISAVVEVNVYDDIYAPEGFSPNGDGINDYFEIALDSDETYTLYVFDRSGQAHYRSNDYKNQWDGTASTGPYSGNKLPAGTYLYTLSTKGTGVVKTGFIVIK